MAQQVFQLQQGDTATRLAHFERNDDSDPIPKVGISITDSQVLLKTNSPVLFLRVFDTGGREAFSWNGKEICDIAFDKAPLKSGIYYIYLEWKGKRNCYKILL